MFSSCLCRVTRSGRPVAISTSITNRTSAASVGPIPLQSFSRQRRHSSSSSSKPSNPPDGPRSIAQQNPTSSSRTKTDNEKRSATRLGRRKGRGAAGEVSTLGNGKALMNLPSVPSTTYLHPSDVAVSAFFSLYRPISVTSSVPSVGTNSSFNTIFNSRSKSSEVISTLSSTVDNLEASQQQQGEACEGNAEHETRSAVAAASASNDGISVVARHVDGVPNDSPLQFPGDLLSGRFRPFNPPPPPTPTVTSKSATMEETPPSERKTYSTVLTILESTLPNGSKTYNVTTSPIVAADGGQTTTIEAHPMRFLGRMLERQERWEEYRSGRDGEGMWSISVKRQRKLKMKKMKYKKLMRRTRNLRRRLDRN